MEPLLKQLRELPARLSALPASTRYALLGGVLLALAVGAVFGLGNFGGDNYQYAFTNLTAEDSTEASQTLKAAGVPFRLDAGGSALAVPSSKVYDARLLLAGAGLPRGGGVGFELFDRGDLGMSEFTQKVNLRRAIEGELARTVSRLSEVRSARVHLTLPEKGLFRDEERKASAAVLLNLQPGRILGEREVAGIRHLVASAVPGLPVNAVTVLDGHGAVLSDEGGESESGLHLKMERELEQRIVSILRPLVGNGAVLARVNVALNTAEVRTNAEVFDPDQTALRSERKVVSNQNQDQQSGGGVAGAAANQPTPPANAIGKSQSRGSSNSQDEVKNFEVTRTTTTTVEREPRLQRLSIAIVLDGVDGKPRSDAEVARLGEIAKRAVGFDEARGDQIDITSVVFSHSGEEAPAPSTPKAAPPSLASRLRAWGPAAGGVALLVVLAAVVMMRRRRPAMDTTLLRPGAKVAELEAAQAELGQLPGTKPPPALQDPNAALRDRARELAKGDPTRAAMLIRAWIAADMEQEVAGSPGASSEASHA